MFRKPVTWIILVVFLLLMALAWFVFSREEIKPADPFDAVPQDAALIIESDKLAETFAGRAEHAIWRELLGFRFAGRAENHLSFLDSVVWKDEQIREIIDDRRVLFSIHQLGRDRYEYLLYLPLPDRNNERDIVAFIESQLGSKGTLSERKYELRKIHEAAVVSDSYRNFSFTVTSGLLIFSHSSILVEEAIRQLDLENSLDQAENFRKVAVTAGKHVDANIYLNINEMTEMVSGLFAEPLSQKIKESNDFAAWSALDLSIKDDVVLFNGFTSAGNQANQYLDLFLDQPAQRIDIHKIFPVDFALYLIFGMDDYQGYRQQYQAFLDIKGGLNDFRAEIDKQEERYSIDIENSFVSIIENELAIVITDLAGLTIEENTFYIIKCKSQALAMETIRDLLVSISDQEQVHLSQLIFEQPVASDFTKEIYHIPLNGLGKYLFGNILDGVNNRYGTFIDNYLVFGRNPKALSRFAYQNILQATLDTDLDYNRLTDYLSAKSNLHLFLNIPHSFDLLRRHLSGETGEGIDGHVSSLSRFQAFSLQVSEENQLFYNNAFINYSTEVKEDPMTSWESRLDDDPVSKPKLVTNHYTNEREIFIQDEQNKIYLVNQSGRILWKLSLPDRIMSDIYQVDYYENGKLQYLFNTETHLHLIDRNGNYVERYPVKLRTPASTGMALFDYERNRDYRIFVHGTDRSITAYDKTGSVVSGWDFDKTDAVVQLPIQHFRIGDRDYLVCVDKYNVYILNRRGGTRVRVREHFPVSQRNNCVLDRGTVNIPPRLVMTDTLGQVRLIQFNGTVTTENLGSFSKNHYFLYEDLDGDSKKEYIFVDGKELQVFNSDKKKKYSYYFDYEVDVEPAVYQFSNKDKKIGIVLKDSQQIYLINNDGTVFGGFPLSGSSMFSIGYMSPSSKTFSLVVGGADNFLYNYSLK